MANLASLVKRFDPGKMLGGAISSGVGRFRSNIGSGDKGYRVMMRGYSTIKSFERRFASRDSGKSRPAGPAGGPTRRAPSTSPTTSSGAPARTDHIAAGEEFTHKGNVYIVPEGHVFDTRSGRLIADPATSKSRSFVSFAKAGVIMQSSFDNFKTVTFRKLDKIIDLVSKLQPSPVVAAPLEEVKKPEEVGAPEKEKPSNWLPFLVGMLSGLGLKYFVRPLVALFQRIMKWITGLWTAVRKLFTRIANAIVSAFKRFWQFMTKIKDAFLRVVKFVKNLIPKTWEALKKIGKNIGEFFTKKFTAAKDFIVKRLSAVRDYLIKLGARALVWLGKMIMKVAPGLASTLKGVAGKAVAAYNATKVVPAPGVNETKASKLLAESKSPGMKLLKAAARFVPPGLNVAATVAFAAIEINDADIAFKGSDGKSGHGDKEKYNKIVGNIVAGALGSFIGGTLGAVVGFALMSKLTTLGALGGGAAGVLAGGVGAAPGALLGGILGGVTGLALAIGTTVLGSVGGELLFQELLNHFGDPEKLGAFIDDLLNKKKNTPTMSGEDYKNTRSGIDELFRNKIITKTVHGEMVRELENKKNSLQRGGAAFNYDRLIPISPVAFSGASGGMSGDLVPGDSIGERIAGDRVGPKATPRVVGGDVSSPPVAARPSDSSPTTVQPVPPQTPPTPDEQRDEFGNIVVINSQTNNRHTTTVLPPHAPRSSTTSPDPWQHIGL